MCYTLFGRLHTRCVSLVGPAILAQAFALATDKPDYWILFVLMLVCGVALDLFVYSWLIGYQPHWLTLSLAIIEFFFVKWVMEWPYPFEIRLHTRQALIFYALAWAMIWLTLRVVLPRIYPRWVEDAGEFRLRICRRPGRFLLADLGRRRQIFLVNTVAALFGGVAWLVATWLTPSEYVFTGLLASKIHFGALTAATHGARGLASYDLAGAIGWLARQGRWPVFSVYQAVWLALAWMWLLCAQLCYARHSWLYLPFLLVPALLLPAPTLMLATACAFALALGTRRRLVLPQLNPLARAVASITAIFILAAGLSLAHPIVYLEQGTWQALTWMSQSVDPETVVATSDEQVDLVASLGGVHASPDRSVAALLLLTGGECPPSTIRFRHGYVCVTALRSFREGSGI
jgi:hypothetical protein